MAFLLAQTLVHLFHVLLLLFCAGNAYFISFCSVFSSSSTTSSFPARIPSATQVRIWFASSSRLNAFIAAVTAAETGHLVMSTLHTIGAAQTIDRIIDAFPPNQQAQIRLQLSMVLQAVISQQLVPGVDGTPIPVFEIMYSTLAIRNMIRESKTHQLDAAIASGAAQGMRTMDMALADLVRQKRITEETALYYCTNYETMQKRLQLL